LPVYIYIAKTLLIIQQGLFVRQAVAYS